MLKPDDNIYLYIYIISREIDENFKKPRELPSFALPIDKCCSRKSHSHSASPTSFSLFVRRVVLLLITQNILEIPVV